MNSGGSVLSLNFSHYSLICCAFFFFKIFASAASYLEPAEPILPPYLNFSLLFINFLEPEFIVYIFYPPISISFAELRVLVECASEGTDSTATPLVEMLGNFGKALDLIDISLLLLIIYLLFIILRCYLPLILIS